MSDTKMQKFLRSLEACQEAILWAGERDLKTAWAECRRGDWMLWLCGKMLGKKGWPTRQQIVLAACDCAELSLPIFEEKYPKDKRPRTAVETTRKWANREASLDDVRSAAADTAAAAAYAASAAAAAYAASAADAYAASAAAAAAYAAYAASAADAYAYAAAASAADAYASAPAADTVAADTVAAAALARVNTLKSCADICRSKLHIPS